MEFALKSLDKLLIENHKTQVWESECEAWWVIPFLSGLTLICWGPMVSSHIVKSEEGRRENDIEATALQKLVIKVQGKIMSTEYHICNG